jgi:hypothetical protein
VPQSGLGSSSTGISTMETSVAPLITASQRAALGRHRQTAWRLTLLSTTKQ